MTHLIDKVLTKNELILLVYTLRHHIESPEFKIRKEREDIERAKFTELIESMKGDTPKIVILGDDGPIDTAEMRAAITDLFTNGLKESIADSFTNMLRKLETALEFEQTCK